MFFTKEPPEVVAITWMTFAVKQLQETEAFELALNANLQREKR